MNFVEDDIVGGRIGIGIWVNRWTVDWVWVGRGRPLRGVAMVDSTIATKISNRKIANIYLGQPGPYCFGIGRTRGLLISS